MALGASERTGVECVYAFYAFYAWWFYVLRLLGIELSTGPAQVQGSHCPSAPTMSGINVIDSHGPRDINLKSLHEAAPLVRV